MENFLFNLEEITGNLEESNFNKIFVLKTKLLGFKEEKQMLYHILKYFLFKANRQWQHEEVQTMIGFGFLSTRELF